MAESLQATSTLIVVCCHAIFLGSSNHNAEAGANEEEEWLIEPFQKRETPTFIEHIKRGVQTLRTSVLDGVDAILLFSGGATKRSRGCAVSEGESYLNLAIARDLFGLETEPPSLRRRMFAEVNATDSYHNVLLSLIQYPLLAQIVRKGEPNAADRVETATVQNLWPDKLILISHAFKKHRFLDLHVPTIRPPIQSIEYVGIDPPFDQDRLAEVVEGDRLRGYGAWKDDLHGTGDLLRAKKLQRGWNEVAFISQVLAGEELWSEKDKAMLSALVRGDEDATWPGTSGLSARFSHSTASYGSWGMPSAAPH